MIVSFDMYKPAIFKPYFEECGLAHASQYKSLRIMYFYISMFNRIRLARRIPLGFVYINPDCPPEDDKIIVFDTHTNFRYLNWLCNKHPDKRIILWYWNPMTGRELFSMLDERIEIWSYNERDAREHGFRSNTQFYFDCLASEAAESAPPAPDQSPKALFVGRDKGREGALMQLKEQLAAAGIEADYRFIRNYSAQRTSRQCEQMVPYREIIDAVKESQYIVDYYADPTAGLSLRAMEALFFGKKLITNRSLMREEDFYDSRNIYILGEEKRSLKEYAAEPYVAPEPAIRDRYLLSNWLKRFDE